MYLLWSRVGFGTTPSVITVCDTVCRCGKHEWRCMMGWCLACNVMPTWVWLSPCAVCHHALAVRVVSAKFVVQNVFFVQHVFDVQFRFGTTCPCTCRFPLLWQLWSTSPYLRSSYVCVSGGITETGAELLYNRTIYPTSLRSM